MNSKIFILALFAGCQVVLAQRPTVFPLPFGTTGVPGFLGGYNTNWVRPYYTAASEGWRTYFEQLQQARNQLYHTLTNLQNTNQNTTSFPATSLPPTSIPATQTARDTIAQILSAFPLHSVRTNDVDEPREILGDLKPPAVEAPAHDVPQEIQVVHTVTRPQTQNDEAPKQVTVTHTVTQTQPSSARQPQNAQGTTTASRPATSQVTSSTRPATSQVTSGVVSQASGVIPQPSGVISQSSGVLPQLGSGIVPQMGGQLVPQVGGSIIPQMTGQVPSWIGK